MTATGCVPVRGGYKRGIVVEVIMLCRSKVGIMVVIV